MATDDETFERQGPELLAVLLAGYEFNELALTASMDEEDFKTAWAILEDELGGDFKLDQAYRAFHVVKVVATMTGVSHPDFLDGLSEDAQEAMHDFFGKLSYISAVMGQRLRERLR